MQNNFNSLKMRNIAIFASGSGSNAEQIIRYFNKSAKSARVALLLSNNHEAYALERAGRLGVETLVFSREDFYATDSVKNALAAKKIDFIVLAGFLWLIPLDIISAYPNRMVNIHPALLPKFGGKGMYGERVHRAVLAAGEKESGITIHYVSAEYDRGDIIFQASCPVLPTDTAATLAERVHKLEHEHFARVVEGEIQIKN